MVLDNPEVETRNTEYNVIRGPGEARNKEHIRDARDRRRPQRTGHTRSRGHAFRPHHNQLAEAGVQ